MSIGRTPSSPRQLAMRHWLGRGPLFLRELLCWYMALLQPPSHLSLVVMGEIAQQRQPRQTGCHSGFRQTRCGSELGSRMAACCLACLRVGKAVRGSTRRPRTLVDEMLKMFECMVWLRRLNRTALPGTLSCVAAAVTLFPDPPVLPVAAVWRGCSRSCSRAGHPALHCPWPAREEGKRRLAGSNPSNKRLE